MNTIYYCGNTVVPEDSGVMTLIPVLQQTFPLFTFIHLDPTEGIPLDNELIILDTVIGINKVTIFNSLHSFAKPYRFTVHDYDLLHDLYILLKLKKIESFKVIGVPAKIKHEYAANITAILKNIYSSPNSQ